LLRFRIGGLLFGPRRSVGTWAGAAGDNVFAAWSVGGLLIVCVMTAPARVELKGARADGTVDWSQWMSLTAEEQNALWAQYCSIVQHEIARNKSDWKNRRGV
jgi:hypothetical protein